MSSSSLSAPLLATHQIVLGASTRARGLRSGFRDLTRFPCSPRLAVDVAWPPSQTVAYTIRPSARSRRLRIWASPETGLVVTVPLWCQEVASVERFLRRHERWVLRQVLWLARMRARLTRWPYGPTLPYRGEEHTVLLERSERETTVRRMPGGTLLVRLERPGIEAARRLLKRWYLGEAARWMTERLAVLGDTVGVSWRRVSVRDQRSRWGSCSATGCLSFNYRLVMAPPEVMDYVIVHELAHRCALNHSERFWAIVAAYCPGYREARDWLKTSGPSLTL